MVWTVIEEYICCDCKTEGLLFRYVPDNEDDPDFVYISMWEEGWNSVSWRHRLRHIWHIITRGNPYTDAICLDRKSVVRLQHFCEVALAMKIYDRGTSEIQLRAGECTTEPSSIENR